MVQQSPHTGLSEYSVQENILSRDEKQLISFPTPICELARLGDRLFVILHTYPIDDQVDYAATNLWALDLQGKVLWRAENINKLSSPDARPNCYRGLTFFDQDSPKIYVMTMDDRTCPVIDIATGRIITEEVILDWRVDYDKINSQIFAKSERFLLVLPSDPPQNSQYPLPTLG